MNRRRGAGRFHFSLKGLLARTGEVLREPRRLGAALGKLRLPVLGRRNRKRLSLARALAPRPEEHVPAPTQAGPEQGPAARRSRLAHLGLFLAWAAPLTAALVAFAMPLIGVRAYEYVMQSGYFHVSEVVVDQTSTRTHMGRKGAPAPAPHLSKNELLEIAGIGAGTHVLEADLEAMSQRLTEHPWIRWARVERELPDKLVIHVVEHVPTAFLAPRLDASATGSPLEAPGLLLVDELGEVFAPAPFDLALPLPVITGVELSRLEDRGETEAIRKELEAGLNVLRIWEAQGMSRRYPVSELRLLPGGAYALVLEGRTAGAATEIVLGRGPFREKLMRLEFILEHLHAANKTAEYILLDVGDELDPRAVSIAGARVVVKADLAIDPLEGLAELAPREPSPPRAPRPRPARPSPDDAPSPAPAVDAPNAPAEPGSPAAPEDPTAAEEPNEGGEAAPLTGGRPADDLGQE